MFRTLLFVAVALLVPGAAAAEPSIQTEADAADTSLGVTVSDLETWPRSGQVPSPRSATALFRTPKIVPKMFARQS